MSTVSSGTVKSWAGEQQRGPVGCRPLQHPLPIDPWRWQLPPLFGLQWGRTSKTYYDFCSVTIMPLPAGINTTQERILLPISKEANEGTRVLVWLQESGLVSWVMGSFSGSASLLPPPNRLVMMMPPSDQRQKCSNEQYHHLSIADQPSSPPSTQSFPELPPSSISDCKDVSPLI